MRITTRRTFVAQTAGAAAAAALLHAGRGHAANDQLVIGWMGLGGRMNQLAPVFCARKDVRTKYICDVDQSRFARAASNIEEITGEIPKSVTDFRKMLEDPEVDIIVNATPHHWHALGAIMACQAGKHVYVEKPLSHNIREGRKMVEAARKYKRVVQAGMQNRSAVYLQQAREVIQSGKLGQIHQVRVMNMLSERGGRGLSEPPTPVPDGMDWDMYCGPAPLLDFRGHALNRKTWDLSAGVIVDDAVHQLDLARWLVGVEYPSAVASSGGVYVFKKDYETPDTQVATWEYPDMLMHLHASLVGRGMSKTPESIRNGDLFPNWLLNATRVEIFGSEAMMIVGRQGGGWQVFGPDGGVMDSRYGRHEIQAHVANFIECIRSGAVPNGDVEKAHISTAICHMANISLRIGGRQLQWDGAKEQFPGDAEANALIGRKGRAPWIIPDEV